MMGSHSFEVFGAGSDPQQVYNELKSAARDEFGYDPYNGTISTTEGFTIMQRTPMSLDEAERLAEKHIDEASKWGPCNAFPVTSNKNFKARVKKLKFRVEHDDWVSREEIDKILKQKLPLAAGESLGEVKTLADEKTFRNEITTGQGSTQLRFVILGPNASRVGTEYETQAQARAALKAHLDGLDAQGGPAWTANREQQFEIIGIQRRTSGDPLIRGERKLKKREITLEVAIIKPIKTPLPIDGWLFSGWAAS